MNYSTGRLSCLVPDHPKRTGPLEKRQQVDSKINLLIFFKYFDGHRMDGMVGFDINAGPPGNT
jgi:hypothetical protein